MYVVKKMILKDIFPLSKIISSPGLNLGVLKSKRVKAVENSATLWVTMNATATLTLENVPYNNGYFEVEWLSVKRRGHTLHLCQHRQVS